MRSLPLQTHHHGHVDGAHHGDGVERVEEVGEEDDVGGGLEAEVPERLQQHGEQVHQVEEAERGQQLVEEAVQLLPGQQEDGGRVAWGISYIYN